MEEQNPLLEPLTDEDIDRLISAGFDIRRELP